MVLHLAAPMLTQASKVTGVGVRLALAGTKPYWEVPSRFKLAPAWSEKAGSVVHKTDATKIHNDRAFVFTACKKLFLAN